ncbi:hypothetical protein [Qipengyuania atrilutea]|uniref:Uncharacterized protein n=1 Tax=Qipengyuania atrilutea TaxID=2744473 RepID=A0A850H2C9_9SPHN|nr:hypothetical protein [Actirhodobacter atriluteus]NVD44836.1 hypothetical protein [Actirhodobacter atriluteus]
MAKTRSILKRQLDARAKIWPDVTNRMLWDRNERDGFSTLPRTMPLIMNIMDGLSNKGFPVGQTYLELWCRLYDELFLTLNRPEEMAFYAGFTGQRAVRTWKDRVKRLADLGFIDLKSGPLGEMSYAIFFNPYHVIKRAYLKGLVQEDKYRALVIRSNEIGAFDLDDIDDAGDLVDPDDDDQEDEEEKKPARRKIKRPSKRSATNKASA